jgi:predicted RNA binding protein YcfA (HicA-like mRNA interferase family)
MISPWTYQDLANRLRALGARDVMVQPGSTTTLHMWDNPQTGGRVTIPDRGGKRLSDGLIDKISEKLGISRALLNGAV